MALCEARGEDETYFRETFEEEDEKFFHNDPNQKTNWVRGAGEERIKARSPSFDHTFFSDRGHYMRMEIIAGETDGTIGKFYLLFEKSRHSYYYFFSTK